MTAPSNPDSPASSDLMQYALRLIETESGIGYFTCVPDPDVDFDAGVTCLRQHPHDVFMRRHLTEMAGRMDKDRLRQKISETAPDDMILRSLLAEVCLLHPAHKSLFKRFSDAEIRTLSRNTPFLYLKSARLKDQPLHRKWIRIFRDNIQHHLPLPSPVELDIPFPFSPEKIEGLAGAAVTLNDLHSSVGTGPPSEDPPPAEEICRMAQERLAQAGVQLGQEMRHVASLSPIALLREWHLDRQVDNGRHHYRFSGKQTAYGRGLDLEKARAACTMEIVERYSSFADIDREGVRGCVRDYPLVQARYSELKNDPVPAIDPNRLSLEAPYRDEPLWWMDAEMETEQGRTPVRVPAQCVFLFANLDEISLYTGLGSTGLAAGSTMAGAKVSALLEVIERDHEGTTPFDAGQCFTVESSDPRLGGLLESYAEAGIGIQFQDMTSAMGIPCCKCFVVGMKGEIIKGTGAHLNARRALVSAMTETPFPYPYGGPSAPGPGGLVRVPVENLPDYTTGSAAGDLKLLEHLLTGNGYTPIYVDLTRENLALPVVRAIVPGMEITADFDRFSRVHPRLFAHYLKLHNH